MDLSAFFEPLAPELAELGEELEAGMLASHSSVYAEVFPDWREADLVLIGCREYRGNGEPGLGLAPDAVREQLYRLSLPHEAATLADLGNLRPRETPQGFYEMLGYVLNELIRAGKTVLLLGGSQDIAYGQYLGYEGLDRQIEYVQVDARFDLENASHGLDNQSYNHQIFVHEPGHLFNFSNLGYQRYFVSDHQRKALKELNYSAMRYGDLNGRVEEAEPYLRLADMLSVDLGAIRHADAPGAVEASPGGFSAMEACQLMRYAGLGYQLSSVSFCEWSPEADHHEQTALLTAMLAWYFMDGFYNRYKDQPGEDRSLLRQYTVKLHASVEQIHFFKHLHTGRWWMEVPHPSDLGQPNPRSLLVPCSEQDYLFAQQDDLPERWWLTFNKLG